VVSAEKVGIPPDWGGAFIYAPLPDLEGDGAGWAVELRTAANIDASYLVASRRLRCLSEVGWAAFRQRMTLCDTRGVISLAALMKIGSSTWHEVALWQQWNAAGRDPAAFDTWLAGREPTLSGFTRRAILERGMFEQISAVLQAELAN